MPKAACETSNRQHLFFQVSEYVRERILALREQHSGQYSNIACLRTNAQKYLINYFRKGQLTKLFFLFPVCFLPDGLLG